MASTDIGVQHAITLLGSKIQQHVADRHSLSSCAMFWVGKHALMLSNNFRTHKKRAACVSVLSNTNMWRHEI